MKVTIDWLKKYVDFQSTPEQLAYDLTMAGLEVDKIEHMSYDFDGIIIGQIVSVKKHETLPQLSICDVNIGSKVLTLVCGAPNVVENLKVPVALEGAKLPDGQIIKRATIHGYDSPGMICSEKELGLSQLGDTIMELDQDSPVGENLIAYLDRGETVIEIDLTPNRPDCLGVLGIAREIAALNGSNLRKPELKIPEANSRVEDFITVVIENPENCPRYCARYIEGVKIGASPSWLVQKLRAVGIRSINNVVDVTNFVMMETGQPLHAFDYNLIEGGGIIVKNAQKGQKFTTLDNMDHILTNEILMICDLIKPIALAGIMGGLNSEVSETTSKILLESAYFNPINIRRSSRYLGISSDSSQRFERGVDPNGTIYALNRTTQLIIEIAGGKAAKGCIDHYVKKIPTVKITLRINKVNNFLGTELNKEDINHILNSLQLTTKLNTNIIEVTVPTFRPDITREVDLIEEIARIYGYNNIAEKNYSYINLLTPGNDVEKFTNLVRDVSLRLGYNEVLTNTFINKQLASHFSLYEPIQLKNPLSDDLSTLRPCLIPNLVNVIKWNKNRRIKNLKLFEIGNIFHWKERSKTHIEKQKISFAISGDSKDENWLEKPRPLSFYDLKGDIETFLNRINIENYKFIDSKIPFFDDRSLEIKCHAKRIGFLGAVKKEILSIFDIDDDIFTAQFDFQLLFEFHNFKKKFTPIPKYPEIRRDLSIVVDAALPVKSVESEILKSGNEFLKSVHLFDLYKGKQVAEDKKSLAFSLLFYSEYRTLTEKEVDENVQEIILALEKNLKAQLRK